ncbi:hypothetical protein [Corynebacterium stationis]|uniref:hypothetical protein n=1 Tax=Corynebacterium stationis TaxID=1705 RepID=UPI00076F6C83|nr:hypothetical protein [Corynebacterium stationis]AMJ45485.1 hypothetical protein AW169_11980 [Corynebacterium stationis]AQX71939.1 hypothetical protein CA21670_11200 [Corynebacterium stationis]ASJ19619.1 hypothetical protein BA700_11960 [Corynebacterium stationis]HJG63763.1 hypothetical protein [Corynebacterium stationis]
MEPNQLTLSDLAALSVGHLLLNRQLTDEEVDGGTVDTYTLQHIDTALKEVGIEPSWFGERLAMYLPKA